MSTVHQRPALKTALTLKLLLGCGTQLLVSCDKSAPPVLAPVVAAPARAADIARSAYEMQERCAKDARDWYKHWWEDPKDSGINMPSSYTNHFNAKLGRCFLVVDATVLRKNSISKMKTLIDVLENRELGALDDTSAAGLPIQCEVAGAHCASATEWDALANRYKEEGGPGGWWWGTKTPTPQARSVAGERTTPTAARAYYRQTKDPPSSTP
jgi:hypothetical protein